MGYRYWYDLSLYKSNRNISDILKILKDIHDEKDNHNLPLPQDEDELDTLRAYIGELLEAIDEYGASKDWDSTDCDGLNLIEISKLFPDEVFELYYQGEDRDDEGKVYFKNGKSQECKGRIVFDELDKSKLN